ncbi:small-conductance mechanosensitive channel [Aquipluma nitroreducens]|uniref:Mechanosensing system component YbdG n=1 Tax=Aquipluma nitroreducens TaxID=2010828 RepID=A0A5K7S4V4_9BACT|nr:mechanosensitive ion channel family protein [Aquipluma nitroreducens]BBE16384.1 small-conductance mechanosensitive channel [Aquipluma nitroreducens]
MKSLYLLLNDVFRDLDFLELYARLTAVMVTIVALFVIAMIVHWITKILTVKIIHRLVEKSKTDWDDYLLKRKVFQSMSHLTSALVFYYSSNFSEIPEVTRILTIFTNIYFVVIFIKVVSGVLKASNDIYLTTPYASTRSIKGYIQLVMILVYFIAGIFIIGIIFDKSPLYLLGGLSAIAAVLLLVFKDTILGLVASIQLSANKMLKPGDWIEMPKHNANGTVIDISLNTVKVQNFDKTISTIPTYSLVADSFLNWSGMEESEGRRIKRSINIDMKSVQFCDEEMLERFKKLHLIQSYISDRQKEITDHNKKLGIEDESYPNGRRQTNLGIFRKYLEEYLKNNPHTNNNMTLLVRHLQPTETGLPVEIYMFSKNKDWVDYEGIQADIFDHILAIIPEFKLRVFQAPSGSDINDLSEKLANRMN